MAACATRVCVMIRHDRDDAADIGFPSTSATCTELRAVVWSYLDDESPRWERRWIRAHLTDCDHCHAYVRFLRAFLRVLRAELGHEHADDAVRQRIRAAVGPETPLSKERSKSANQD